VNRRIAKSASQPARKSLTAVSLSIAALFAVPAAHALELKLEDGWKGSLDTTVSLGTSWRMQAQDPKLYAPGNGTPIGITGGLGATNTDSGNLNWSKGDQFSTLLKVTSDLSLSKGDLGAFARVRAWYDYALEDQTVNRGHASNGWTANSKLSDSGYDRLQKFSGIALLDAYVFNTFDISGNPLQLRLGNQVLNWGESLFIQGVNQINPIDLSALRKPGAEVRDAFLPIAALSANLGLAGGTSLEAFYQFRWTPSNIDSCGAYFGVVETQLTHKANQACSSTLTTLSRTLGNAVSRANNAYVSFGEGQKGEDSQFGLAFRFPLESVSTEFGVYAAQISSRVPFLVGQRGTIPGGLTPPLSRGSWNYPNDIKILGASASTNISGWSVGAEVSTTRDQPAQINAADLLQGLLASAGPFAPRLSGTPVNTPIPGYDLVEKSQLQVNAIKLFPRLLGSAQGTVVGEVGYQRTNVPDSFTGIRYGRAFIFGRASHSTLTNTDAGLNPDTYLNDGFVTDNSWGYRARLGLEYPNFLNTGATLFPTFSFSHDVSGYSVDNQFIEDRKVYGASFRFNIQRVHNIELSYIQYGDSAKYDPFRDRDFMSLVFSTTF